MEIYEKYLVEAPGDLNKQGMNIESRKALKKKIGNLLVGEIDYSVISKQEYKQIMKAVGNIIKD